MALAKSHLSPKAHHNSTSLPLGPERSFAFKAAPQARTLISPSDDQITESACLETCLEEIVSEMASWNPHDFILKSILQESLRANVNVALMTDRPGSASFAVKRMAIAWARPRLSKFAADCPDLHENPWTDLAIGRALRKTGYPYICKLMGVFFSDDTLYVVSSLATEGDLFTWCHKAEPRLGANHAREEIVFPLAVQLFSAVRLLHELGIAHRDLSLENVLVTKTGGESRIMLIAIMARFCKGQQGKLPYQAPEMHSHEVYHAFLADDFAVGVILYAVMVLDYPWKSTKPNTCKFFHFAESYGMVEFLEKRKWPKGKEENTEKCLLEVLSLEFIALLTGLLQLNPEKRMTLGELCFRGTETDEHPKAQQSKGAVFAKASVWDSAWIRGMIRGGICQSV